MRLFPVLLLLTGSLTAGCGGGVSTPTQTGETPPENANALLPWKVGNRWTYKVTEDGEVSEKVTVIGEPEAVGGTGVYKDVMANKVTTSKSSGARTLSWQTLSGSRVVRYREQSLKASDGSLKSEELWDPPKLHVDESSEHTGAGASWLEITLETEVGDGTKAATTTSVRDRWTVVSEAQSVTVPAGTFQAVVLQKAGSGTPKTYWFVRGIGKVKEEGGQTEELVSYELQP